MCIAAAIGGGALIGAAGSYFGGKQQAQAAQNAQNIAMQQFQTTNRQEQPYMQAGYGAQDLLNNYLGIGHAMKGQGANYGSLLKPFTIQDFQSLSPAYKFQRQQGMQGVLNGDAAGQGALSGAAQKDLMGYNQNLANTAFNNAFNMYQTQQGNIYQRLAGIAQQGQAAAAGVGQQGTALSGQAGQAAQNYGTAMGGAITGATGAIGNTTSALPWLMSNKPPSTTDEETAMAYSDRRLKEDIKRIGTLDSGLPVYSFRYHGSSQVRIGVMADEVVPKIPDAVSSDEYGYLMVDYGKL